jgi:hypothetical protein
LRRTHKQTYRTGLRSLGVPVEWQIRRAERLEAEVREVDYFLPNRGRRDIIYQKITNNWPALPKDDAQPAAWRRRPGLTRKPRRKPLKSLKTDSLTGRARVAERQSILANSGSQAILALVATPTSIAASRGL